MNFSILYCAVTGFKGVRTLECVGFCNNVSILGNTVSILIKSLHSIHLHSFVTVIDFGLRLKPGH